MDIWETVSDYSYTHGGGLKKSLDGLEIMISFAMGNQEKAAPYLKRYEALIRQHGACTPQSVSVLKAIATAENRDIITTGNLLHLGNCTQTENEPPLVSPNHLLYSVDETASVLGVGRDTVLAWAKAPTFPAFRTGNGKNAPIRVNAAGLQPWIDEQCKGEV